MKIDLDREERTATSKLIATLAQQFPEYSSECFRLWRESKSGITLEVTLMKEWHTRPQQNYYRKWCREFAKWCGMTPDEMHEELLCRCYGSEEVETKMGLMRRPLIRSSEANKGTFSELIDTLIGTAAEMGFVVPLSQDPYTGKQDDL
jgi:hypothetical protein